MPRPRWYPSGSGVLLLALGCTSAGSHVPPTGAPPPPGAEDRDPLGGGALERRRTGALEPSLTILSSYPRVQYVFLDGRLLGSVAPGQTVSFSVPSGAHVVVCADSEDLGDNPTELEGNFEEGYGYTFRLDAE